MSPRSFFAGALGLSLLALVLPVPLTGGCIATCSSSAECAKDEFCSIADGACLTAKSVGFCKPRPSSCTKILQPVCGCDGLNYDNACEATKQGSPVANTGVCGAACGGISAAKCADGQYCELALGDCGQATPTGVCKAPPADCPTISDPVCGCDGKTYQNGCLASKAQVSVISEGDCACGGSAKTPCEAGRYCELPSGACLGANATGQCKDVPTACPAIKNPICGCDSKTYDNACEAAKVKISVAAITACGSLDGG